MAIIDYSNGYGVGVTITSAILVTLISDYLHRSKWIYPSNVVQANNDYYYWRYRNFLISFMHASITGFSSMAICFHSPMLLLDVLDAYNELGYLLSSFSLGYFIYDTIEMFTHRSYKGTRELIFHHILILACFSNTVLMKRYVGYNMVALIIEVSNVFLHFRQLLLLSNHSKNSSIYFWNSVTNVVVFIFVRFGSMFWLWYTLLTNLDRIPLVTKVIAYVAMSGITVTTAILFYRVINADFIDDGRRQRSGQMNATPAEPSLYSEDDDGSKKESLSNGNSNGFESNGTAISNGHVDKKDD